jgi:hypothetical protein
MSKLLVVFALLAISCTPSQTQRAWDDIDKACAARSMLPLSVAGSPGIPISYAGAQ